MSQPGSSVQRPAQLWRALWPLAGGVVFLLALSGCSLAGDIQPPPGYSTSQSAQPVSQNLSPLMPPDPSSSGPVYAEKCAPCHGASGMGDGEMAGQLPVMVPAIGSPDVARAARPVEWFDVISNGRMSNGMPPFSGSLSERQRWDLIAYVMTLNGSKEQLAQGHDTYVILCQDCHGEAGQGNGLRAASLNIQPPDWTNPANLAQLSDQDIWQAITTGSGSDMPAFSDRIQPDVRWALAAYVRTLGFVPGSVEPHDSLAAAQAGQPDGQPAPAASAETASIQIQVSNGSGGQVPAGMEVNLEGFDQNQPATQYTCSLQADQTCTIEGVALAAQRVYVAWAIYKDQRFLSNILQSVPAGQQTNLPLPIYETTSDRSHLSASRVHIFLEFPEAGIMRVSELFLIDNPGKLVVTPEKSGGMVLSFKLPPGATNLQFDNGMLGDRFVSTADGFGDTAPLLPGPDPNQLLFAYDLPYSRKLSLALESPLPVQSFMVVVPEQDGVRLQSSQLQPLGQQSVQGMNIQLYGIDQLPAGQAVQMTVSGHPPASATQLVSRGTAAGMVFGAAILFATLGLSGLWIYRRRKAVLQPAATAPEAPATPLPPVDELLDAIVTLDDLYRSGQLPLEAYQERRAELKEKLKNKKAES